MTFKPARNFTGTARFTPHDRGHLGATGSAIVSVEVGNAAPRFRNDEVIVLETATVVVATVLDNDTDTDGDPLTVTAVGAGRPQRSARRRRRTAPRFVSISTRRSGPAHSPSRTR
ncbi:MAG: Ig-like domain-containing protein [Ilumatobacteraceae bacterium]